MNVLRTEPNSMQTLCFGLVPKIFSLDLCALALFFEINKTADVSWSKKFTFFFFKSEQKGAFYSVSVKRSFLLQRCLYLFESFTVNQLKVQQMTETNRVWRCFVKLEWMTNSTVGHIIPNHTHTQTGSTSSTHRVICFHIQLPVLILFAVLRYIQIQTTAVLVFTIRFEINTRFL